MKKDIPPNKGRYRDAQFDLMKKIGATFKRQRKQKGMTQAQVIKLDTPDQICSLSTIRRIECGEIMPSTAVFIDLLLSLGTDPIQFACQAYDPDATEFGNQFDAIWDMFFEKRYHEASKKLNQLKANLTWDYCNPYVDQALLLCEAVTIKNIKHEYDKCISILHKALLLTEKTIWPEDSTINCTLIAERIFTLSEYQIINVLATTMYKLGQHNKSIELLNAVHASLLNRNINVEIRKKLMPYNCFNLSTTLYEEGAYQESLDFSEKGIKFCDEAKIFKIYGKLLFNAGYAHKHLKNESHSTAYFKKSRDFFNVQGDYANAEHVEKTVAEEFGITI